MVYWKRLIYTGLACAPMLWFLRARMPQPQSIVLMYHELARDDADIEAWSVVRESQFLRQIEYLDRHYDIISLDQAIAGIQAGDANARPTAVITFDDGDRGNATLLLPIVEAHKIPVTVYIATRQVKEGRLYWFDRIVNALQTDQALTLDLRTHGLSCYAINHIRGARNWHQISRLLEDMKALAPQARDSVIETVLETLKSTKSKSNCRIEPMTIDDVKALAASAFVTIGAHSHCHNLLTQIHPDDVEHSVRTSKTLLEQWIGRPVQHFAYPNGSYSQTVMDIVRRAGFRSAVTTETHSWRHEESVFSIPRIGIGRYDSLALFKLKLLGGMQRLLPWRSAARRVTPPVSPTCMW